MTSGHQIFSFHIKFNSKFISQTKFSWSLRVVRPGRLYIVSVRDRLVLLQTCLSLGGGGSVAVACGARLSCSVFMVYSVLLFVSLVASAPI